jgi:GTPase SAR1 family protein
VLEYVIAPVAGVLLPIILTFSLGYAFIVSIKSFVSALDNHIDPYTTYVDKSPNAQPGTKRNYFFGPGYHQIAIIIKESFASQKAYLATLKAWKNRHISRPWYLYMWIWLFYVAAFFCTFVLGYTWMGAFLTLLSLLLFIGMTGFFLFFMALWALDRLLLIFESISSRCMNCKTIAIVPVFECGKCGLRHKKLTPGPYGVLKRKCACGEKLPTTLFTGRSKLQAHCPYCDAQIAASDAHQFGIQLVGAMSAGKTAFLTSFWHQYLLASKSVIALKTERIPDGAFTALEYWFNRGLSVSTPETNANMYSVIHHLPGETPLQFTFYDIAGEAFSRLDENIQQQQFKYCEGIIFIVDPTAPIALSEDALVGFLKTFKALKGNISTKLSPLPVAIIISKADVFEEEIGLIKIISEHIENSSAYADAEGSTSFEQTRDGVCRAFLVNHGFTNVVNLLDSEFTTTSVFPVSAMGHEAFDGKPYEPWGVMPSAFWLLNQSDVQSQMFFRPVEAEARKLMGDNSMTG